MTSDTQFRLGTIVKRAREPVATPVDADLVMMDVELGKYYGLNPVATRIWELLEEPISISQMCDKLQQEFDVQPEACLTEVTIFLRQLQGAALLEIA